MIFLGHAKSIGEKSPYLVCWLFVHGGKSPSLLAPCSKPTALGVARSPQAFTATFTKIHGHLETLHGHQIFHHGHFYGHIAIAGQKIVKALMDR
jgi:hypothetical protein